MAWHGMAWLDMAWHGMARLSIPMAWRGMAQHGVALHGGKWCAMPYHANPCHDTRCPHAYHPPSPPPPPHARRWCATMLCRRCCCGRAERSGSCWACRSTSPQTRCVPHACACMHGAWHGMAWPPQCGRGSSGRGHAQGWQRSHGGTGRALAARQQVGMLDWNNSKCSFGGIKRIAPTALPCRSSRRRRRWLEHAALPMRF